MEDELDNIAHGQKKHYELCDECYGFINDLIKTNNLAAATNSANASGVEKIQIAIDAKHTYLIGKHGPTIKYTKEGEVAVETELNKKEKTMTTIIRDTGVGMTQDQMKNLFTNYTKIINNRELNREGVGLGLMISKNLAKALGGDIYAES
jgi:signal transduction histidine kinase